MRNTFSVKIRDCSFIRILPQSVDSAPECGILQAMWPSVVLYDAAHQRWLTFDNPVDVVTTKRIGEVKSALGRIQEQLDRDQLWAAGFLSYEAASAFDDSLVTHSDSDFPKLWFGIFREPRICDSLEDSPDESLLSLDWKPAIQRSSYDAAIAQIKERIALGDTYQVNFTMRMHAEIETKFEPAKFFRALTHGQEAWYAAYLDIGDFAICSASPELFFRLDGNRITTRPMKGTIKRGRTTREDTQFSEWLHNSEKNRAENVMIVDMMRHDFGRIAQIGSVKVPQLFQLERYPTVWQMTSEVTAATDATFCEIIAALFPAASVTGAPKPRTMQIITELESEPRRIYTGAIGFIAPRRQAQFNVAIRTVLIDRNKKTAEYGVGGGIVWDSIAAEEYDECLVKTQVLATRPLEFSLLETMRWTPAEGCFLLEYHLKRLSDSADYFGFAVALPQIRALLAELADSLNGRQRVRLLVDRKGEITIQHEAISENPTASPVRLRLADQPIDSSDIFLYHKTTNRAVYDNARRAVPACDDVVLFNEHGHVTETGIDNIVIEKSDGTFATPPVSSGLLAGTYRAFLLDQSKIIEEIITLDDLKTAASIAVINSVRGWRKAALVAD